VNFQRQRQRSSTKTHGAEGNHNGKGGNQSEAGGNEGGKILSKTLYVGRTETARGKVNETKSNTTNNIGQRLEKS